MNIRIMTLIPMMAASASIADQLTVSIDSLWDPTTFSITEGDTLNLRVIEQLAAEEPNSSTHILIDGLLPLEEGSSVYASTYRGIDSTTGVEQDVGVLYLDMPDGAALPEGTVSSPIVGVVQRPGTWADFSPATPATSLGGAAGTSDISSGGDVIEAQLARGAESFSGSIPYTVIDTDTIELGAFTILKDGASSIDLSGTTMVREGMDFVGTVTNLSAGAAYDALVFSIDFTDIPDLDVDGIPDITDPDVQAGGLTVGEWQQIEIGWVYGDTSDWGTSAFMGSVYMPFYPYIYQINLGWLYHLSANGTDHVFYDWEIDWILASEGNGGWFFYFESDPNVGNWSQFSEPQP